MEPFIEDDDIMGRAVEDYLAGETDRLITVVRDREFVEYIPVAHLFRTYPEMPPAEQTALSMCYGKVLDIGACAGCHSLNLQQNGIDVTALERSERSCSSMKKYLINSAICSDIFDYCDEQFDTLLLLMNGVGIAQTLSGLPKLLGHLKSLLKTGGQILMDSTDLDYLFKDEEGSTKNIEAKAYHGDTIYRMVYKNYRSAEFKWLFADFESLYKVAERAGFNCNLAFEEAETGAFLVRLTLRNS